MPCSVASDLGLHCLCRGVCLILGVYTVNLGIQGSLTKNLG